MDLKVKINHKVLVTIILSCEQLLGVILGMGFSDSSVGKESVCKAGDPASWVWKISWRRDRLPTPVLDFPCGSACKESTCNVGDLGLIPGL